MDRDLVYSENGIYAYVCREVDPMSPMEETEPGARFVIRKNNPFFTPAQTYPSPEQFMETDGKSENVYHLSVYASGNMCTYLSIDASHMGKWIGYVYIDGKEMEEKLEGWKELSEKNRRRLAVQMMEEKIDALNHYFENDVWEYIIQLGDEEEYDGCGGFSGRQSCINAAVKCAASLQKAKKEAEE